jgi:transcriptional regulator with XRE-family HTH domain
MTGQLSDVRGRRGLTADQLANRCQELGATRIDRSVIAKIESRARNVSLDEAIALAAALDIALIHLISPMDDNQEVAVTPELLVPAPAFRAWVRGQEPLPGQEDKPFRTEVPASEWRQRSARIAAAQRGEAGARRRLRVANAKADLILEELGQLPRIAWDPASRVQEQKLEARLDVAYDRIAEATVELEDAQDRLRYMLARDGTGSRLADASGASGDERTSASEIDLDSGTEVGATE